MLQPLLQLIQQVHGFDGSQGLHGGAAEGFQYCGTGQVTHRELIAFAANDSGVGDAPLLLQLAKDVLSPFDDLVGDTCQLGHFDAVALVGTTGDDLAKKHDVISALFGGDVIVFDPGISPSSTVSS